MGTIILPSYLVTTARETPKQNWGVRVIDGEIAEVGPNTELRAKYPGDTLIDGTDHVLSPGFVNAHVHLYGVLAHGIPLLSADEESGGGWAFLDDFWWPLVEDALDHEMMRRHRLGLRRNAPLWHHQLLRHSGSPFCHSRRVAGPERGG